MKRAVIYCRVSRSTDESVSVDRQERELRELAAGEGWPIVGVFRDDGLSGRVDRAKADAALQAVADGDADVLLVWEMSRWSRMGLGSVAKLVDVLRSRDGALFVAKKEGLRSDQPTFGIMAAVIAELARAEAEGTRDRVLSMRAHHLSATEPADQRWLGGKVPFGYRVVDSPAGVGRALAVDEREADHVRALARLLADGGTVSDATRRLSEAAVPTPQSAARRAAQAGEPADGLDAGEWRITTVRKLMQSPTLVGRTTQRVEVGRRSDGTPITEDQVVTDAQGMPIQRWEPVLDPATFAAAQEAFRRRGPNQARKAASWLSGLLFCGLCGGVMYANSRATDRGRSDQFRCANKAVPGRQCPGVSVSRPAAEAYLEGVILAMVGDLPEYRVTERVEGPAEGELAEVAQAVADVQVAFGRDGADYAALTERMRALTTRRRELLDAPGRTVRTSTPTGRSLADAWSEGDIRQRRALMDGMLQGVEVQKATVRGRASRIEDRLDVHWVEAPGDDD